MNDSRLSRFVRDSAITTDDIPDSRRNLTAARALLMKDEIRSDEYISVMNQNNLSEVLIYRRNDFKTTNNAIIRWDGATKDYHWYEDHQHETVFDISNAEELAALSDLVAQGIDFAGKTIRLISDINLNGRRWTPIGRDGVKRGVFRGIFNGNHRGIYNLTIIADDADTPSEGKHFAFFDKVENATIKNVTFEHAHVNDARLRPGGVAVVCVDAVSSIFVNVVVSGAISGNKCAAIALCAEKCSFFHCINRADIFGRSFFENDNVICGGLVSSIQITEKEDDRNMIVSFTSCVQEGAMGVKILHDVGAACIGQIYGRVRIYNNVNTAMVRIDRCSVKENRIEIDPKTNQIKYPGFFGRVNTAAYGRNYTSSDHKVDLLDGLIGSTPVKVGVTISKATSSVIANGVVIPGSVNTLISKPEEATFVTYDSMPLGDMDGVTNLTPYYAFIKRDTI